MLVRLFSLCLVVYPYLPAPAKSFLLLSLARRRSPQDLQVKGTAISSHGRRMYPSPVLIRAHVRSTLQLRACPSIVAPCVTSRFPSFFLLLRPLLMPTREETRWPDKETSNLFGTACLSNPCKSLLCSHRGPQRAWGGGDVRIRTQIGMAWMPGRPESASKVGLDHQVIIRSRPSCNQPPGCLRPGSTAKCALSRGVPWRSTEASTNRTGSLLGFE